MKKLFLLLMLAVANCPAMAQKPEAAQKLVAEGVELHDKGEYDRAIALYDEALKLDKDNLAALAEKSFSLLSQRKFDEAIVACQLVLEKYPDSASIKTVYLSYANALDGQKKPKEALAMYDRGIAKYPDFYQFYFNKGVTLAQSDRFDEAMTCFERAVSLNPRHPSSHNALGRMLNAKDFRVPAVMAFCRLLILEPKSGRANEDLVAMQTMMMGGVKKTGRNAVTINVDASALPDTTAAGKAKPNNFATTQLIMTLDAALDFDKKFKNLTPVEQFARHLGTICSSLKETQPNSSGFYWTYYAPYFIELRDKDFLKTFSYLAFASTNDPKVEKWLTTHKAEITAFYEWSSHFDWPKG